jgi:hypothetical protein
MVRLTLLDVHNAAESINESHLLHRPALRAPSRRRGVSVAQLERRPKDSVTAAGLAPRPGAQPRGAAGASRKSKATAEAWPEEERTAFHALKPAPKA